MSRLTDWAKLPQEKRDEYNAKKRADYAKQNMDGWRELDDVGRQHHRRIC